MNLIIMCGLPRSGKSTWIKKNKKKNEIVVSKDVIRRTIFGHQYHENAEMFVWAVAESLARLLLMQGSSVIIDETNISRRIRAKWINIGQDYGAKTTIVWVTTTIKKCFENNKRCDISEKVPEEVIEDMATYFIDPSNKEGCRVVLYPKNKKHNNKVLNLSNAYFGELNERKKSKDN
jgi:predicted kinase